MKRTTARILVFLVFLAVLGLIRTNLVKAGQAKPKTIWKLGTLAPRGVGYVVRFEQILRVRLREATNGDLDFKLYCGGVMGDDQQHLKKLRIGQLQCAGLSGQGTFMMSPELPVLGLPFLFNDYDEVDYIKEKMTPDFDAIVSKNGYRLLTWLDQDFDQIYSTNVPVARVEDFPKTTFITWFGPMEGRLLERLGSQPVPMGIMEIPPSVRSGIADSLIGPSIYVVGTQLYATFRYVNPERIRYVPGFAVASTQAWDSLSETYRKNIKKGRGQWAAEFNAQTREDGKKCLEAIIKYGVKEVKSSPEDLALIKEKALPIWDELAGPLYPKELLDRIKGHLKDFRDKRKAPGAIDGTAERPEGG